MAIDIVRRLEANEGDDPLEWEVGLFLALNAAMHDAAIACWEVKMHYDSIRPISLIRHMASLGQCSDPQAGRYDPLGLPLIPGLIELITVESSSAGQRHEHLGDHIGEIALFCWEGAPLSASPRPVRVGWVLGGSWTP
jgi:hypothetical protein